MKVEDAIRPSSVVAGPKGLTFMGLRGELEKLDGKMETKFMEVQ